MPKTRDVVIIGGGLNGLITAFYLAKNGFKPLVLEHRNVVGDTLITDEFHPGFKCSTLLHTAGPIHPDLIRDLALHRHGLQIIQPELSVFAPHPDGRALLLYDSVNRSISEIKKFSSNDASRYSEFQLIVSKLSQFIEDSVFATPQPLNQSMLTDVWNLLRTTKQFRSLGRENGYRLLRWIPMPVADLVTEWFETDLLQAVVAARGIVGTFMGPRSPGTGLSMLLQASTNRCPLWSTSLVVGGLGAMSQAIASAAKGVGAEIRTNADVSKIVIRDGSVSGVVVAGGEEISSKIVVSNADPKKTFLHCIDPMHLDSDFTSKIRRFRYAGTAAKVNLALGDLPDFKALLPLSNVNVTTALSGRIHIGPDLDYLERAYDSAKYGDFSEQPYLDITIPTVTDPSLAPTGCHVMSIYMQFAPYTLKGKTWADSTQLLADKIIRTVSTYVPKLENLILGRQVITPLDLETTYGLTGGHIFHGEPTFEHLFNIRSAFGWKRFRTPIKGLYFCDSSMHPADGITGGNSANVSREIIKTMGKKL